MARPPTQPHLAGRWIRDTTRKAIYERDGYHCQRCGRDLRGAPAGELVLHHVVKGGGNDADNLQLSCKSCNDSELDAGRSADKSDDMAAADLLKKLKAAKAKKTPAKKAKAKKPMKDALGVSGKPKVVSGVNKKGTAAAKRSKVKGKPASRRSLAAKPDSRAAGTMSNKKKASSLL